MKNGASSMSAPHSPAQTHRSLSRGARDGLVGVAFWQFMTFIMLILLVWLNELMDLASLWFGVSPSPPSVFRGCVISIGTIVVALVTVGHTYVQQKQIISGLLTVCSSCRRIRVDEKLWEQLDDYIADHSVALISHGICPLCFEAMKQELRNLDAHNAAMTASPVQSPPGAG